MSPAHICLLEQGRGGAVDGTHQVTTNRRRQIHANSIFRVGSCGPCERCWCRCNGHRWSLGHAAWAWRTDLRTAGTGRRRGWHGPRPHLRTCKKNAPRTSEEPAVCCSCWMLPSVPQHLPLLAAAMPCTDESTWGSGTLGRANASNLPSIELIRRRRNYGTWWCMRAGISCAVPRPRL